MDLFFTYIFVLGACAGLIFAYVQALYGPVVGPDLRNKPLAQLGMGLAFVILVSIVVIVSAILSLFGIKDDLMSEMVDENKR